MKAIGGKLVPASDVQGNYKMNASIDGGYSFNSLEQSTLAKDIQSKSFVINTENRDLRM